MSPLIKKIWIRSKGSEATPVERALAIALRKEGFTIVKRPQDGMDLCVSAGGDGTFLAALRELGEARFDIPVLGVHASKGRGFLLPLTAPKVEKGLPAFCTEIAKSLRKGEFELEERWGLEGKAFSPKGKLLPGDLWALNDMVITRSTLSRLVWLRIFVDGGELFSRLRGDGFIVSSALGSTAYSLSAGGPVVDPLLKNILVTPICPQTLAHRSVLLGENAVVRVEVLDNDTPSYLTGDGQAGSEFGAGQSLEVRRAERPVLFCVPYKLAPAYREPFQALRGKLGFGV